MWHSLNRWQHHAKHVTTCAMHHSVPARASCVLALLLNAFMPPAHAQITYRPIASDPVTVDGGRISGTYLPSGVRAYLGVPFAAAPVRENRWRAPQPVPAWPGVYTANRLAPECMQTLRSSNINHYFGEEATSEDCLYLNIWSPGSVQRNDKLPVVVWIYGGGFGVGSAASPLYSGESLARKGVVYVSLNYRLGVLGFLAHPQASAESPQKASGNWGFLDQVAALQWIQRNIARFGGDPNNVMLAGQSAGSMSINNLQASPLAKGLFHKILGMSGSTLQGPGSEFSSVFLAQSEAQGSKLQEALRVTSLSEMRAISADKVMAAAQSAQVRAVPSVDGYFLPQPVPALFAARQFSDVPIVVGATANDIGMDGEIRRSKTLSEYQAAVTKTFGAQANEVLQAFPANNDETARAMAEQIALNSGISLGARLWARTQTVNGSAPAYLFLFARTQPYVPGVRFADHDPNTAGAYHTGDVPYWLQTQDVFNLIRPTRAWTAYDRQLAETMSDVLIAFAKTGKPNTQQVTLPRFDLNQEQRVVLGDSIRIESLNTKALNVLADASAVRGPQGAPTPGAAPRGARD